MTNVPEVFLAREAQICYATVGSSPTTTAGWTIPRKHVSVSAIFELYGQSLAKARQLLEALLTQPRHPRSPRSARRCNPR